MRIRNAAIAGATAIAVAFGGTTIASAQQNDEENVSSDVENTSSELSSDEDAASEEDGNGGSLSSRIGDSELVDKGEGDDKNTQFNGRDVFGSSKDHDNIPSWAESFYALTIVASIGSLIGLVVGPAANYFQFGQ